MLSDNPISAVLISGDLEACQGPTDIDKDVAELVARGVEFEEYDAENFKTVDHVVTSPGIGRSAWFKDPDGNTIALFQPE